MHPRLRTALVIVVATILAVMLGLELAEGSYFWASAIGVAVIATILVRFTGMSADAIFIGFLLVGYIVGNRGFAQLTLSRYLPLLPAEAGLLLALSWGVIQCAFQREIPFRRDAINWAVLAWLAVGSARLIFDLPRYHLLAVRDFAVVYYALFFFVVQHLARQEVVRRYYMACLVFAVVVTGPLFLLFIYFEPFFTRTLTLSGVPLIFYKSDMAATHLAAGTILLFYWARGRHRFWAWTICAALTLFLVGWDNRASQLGAAVAAFLLLAARRWQLPALQAGVMAAACAAVLIVATVFDSTWAAQKIDGIKDRALSLVDVAGTARYGSDENAYKADNNRFRLVWWRNVALETWGENPAFGLGFGADLSRGFLQEYYPDALEDFTARSPHNVFLGIFGRLGLAGAIVWLAFCLTLLARTWASLRHGTDPGNWSLWCAAWVILVSATFGVVLEGPMGAVVFWSILGLANGTRASDPAATTSTETPATPALAAT